MNDLIMLDKYRDHSVLYITEEPDPSRTGDRAWTYAARSAWARIKISRRRRRHAAARLTGSVQLGS
jgi:hypothetical protein